MRWYPLGVVDIASHSRFSGGAGGGFRVCFRWFSGGLAGLGGVIDGWALGIHSSIAISNRNENVRFRFHSEAWI